MHALRAGAAAMILGGLVLMKMAWSRNGTSTGCRGAKSGHGGTHLWWGKQSPALTCGRASSPDRGTERHDRGLEALLQAVETADLELRLGRGVRDVYARKRQRLL